MDMFVALGDSATTQETTATMDMFVTLRDSDLLNCPICVEPLRPPVYQCDNGHYVCESCCKKINNRCPTCTLAIGFSRCRAIEKVVESAFTSCAYTQYGCKEKISYLAKPDHEKTCKYFPISCPERECQYVGEYKCLYTHFAENHRPNSYPIAFNTTQSINLNDENLIFIQERDSKILFVLHCVSDPLGKFINVSCVAPTASDMKFSYELTAARGENSVTLRSSMKLRSDCYAIPAKKKCHLFRDDFFRRKRKDVQLVIRRTLN